MRARRPLLIPFVPLYSAALGIKRMLEHDRGRFKLANPVISVGSLSAGGAGKTPAVEALAGLLTRHGYAVDVLSRGYGRSGDKVERVDPQGSAERFGDEPLLLARRTGVPVYVGANRYEAGLMAERNLAKGEHVLHLLDDGFQHRQLARNLDIVLLTEEDAKDRLLPGGNLREPLNRLRSADVVVARQEEEASLLPIVRGLVGDAGSLWSIRRRIEMPSFSDDTPRRPVAFCGIARPDGFFGMLRAEDALLAETVAFGDHHRYRERDTERLLDEARRSGANGFVTTEKDAVKISSEMRSRLETIGPMMVARLTAVFAHEDDVMARIQEAIGPPST